MDSTNSENTEPKQGGPRRFLPGQSGNPAGRPKGSRNKLGEAFLRALHDDFAEHGPDVIATVRAERPQDYLKVVASTLPKEVTGLDGEALVPTQLNVNFVRP